MKNGQIETAATIEKMKDAILYPNPATDIISIQTEKTIDKVEILNIAGVTVLTSGSAKTITLESLPTGMYIIKIITTQETIIRTFVKQ